jgi:hypothetical protein
MNLFKAFPDNLLRYQWQQPQGLPYNPAKGIPFPLSRRGWCSIGAATAVVPTGTQVHAQAPLGDGTRGILTLWADWFKGIGGTNNFISIALLETGDAVPALFAANPTNCKAGRRAVATTSGESATLVAADIATLVLQMLGIASLLPKWTKGGGQFVANMARADLGNGTVAMISPAPWRASSFATATGAWTVVDKDVAFDDHPGTYRPELLAGVRPAPWLVVGNPTIGRGQEHSIIG